LEAGIFPSALAPILIAAGGMYSHPFIHAEFVCSDFGPIGNFEAELRNELMLSLKTKSV
jgi:hypothetical protein